MLNNYTSLVDFWTSLVDFWISLWISEVTDNQGSTVIQTLSIISQKLSIIIINT